MVMKLIFILNTLGQHLRLLCTPETLIHQNLLGWLLENKQWGYAVEGTTKVSFPIVFNALFVVSNSQKYNAQSDDVDNILTTNNTYFTKSNLANAFAWWWIAVGK